MNDPTILLLVDLVKYTSLLITLFKKVSDVFALLETKLIKLLVMLVETPMTADIACNVFKTSGALPTRFAISSRTSCFVYESKPFTVIVLSLDDKVIFVPGTIIFYNIK